MPKKRTKANKIKALRLRKPEQIELTNHVADKSSVVSQSGPSINTGASMAIDQVKELVGYPIKLIYNDLLRSLVLTVLLIAVLLGIFLYTSAN